VILMARRRAHLTQRELAARVGCRQATIARWERGDRHAAFEDVQDVVGACGLQLEAHLVAEDRSWWPQIAAQLDCTPAERVRRLAPPGVFADLVAALEALADTRLPVIVIGEVAGALQGWPLVLSGEPIEVCARADAVGAALKRLGATDIAAGAFELPSGARMAIVDAPLGTSGYGDLARGAETLAVDRGSVQVAGLLDLLRIADASLNRDSRRNALAYQAVLDVQRALGAPRPVAGRTDEERIESWLSKQTPVA
jgi:transcriptional regulator with XRE-family HTH domain